MANTTADRQKDYTIIARAITKVFRIAIVLWISSATNSWAQEFSVASFRMLPNDVSAFIHPVRDLNDEACALVKVEAPLDFAFSSPLGIAKRKDEIGEIWLYLPKGSKTITLKHPTWGVIRDYRFGKPLESRMTYELKLNMPHSEPIATHDTIVEIKTIVDTIRIAKKRVPMPWATHIMLSTALHTDGPSWGIMVAALRRHGGYIHLSTNLKSTGHTIGSCDKDGYTEDNQTKPYYTGHTRHSNYTATIGAIHYLAGGICIFEGGGYGKTSTAWQLADSEGGGYVVNEGISHKGIAAEAGLLISLGKFNISASAITIACKQWQAAIGIGIKTGKDKK